MGLNKAILFWFWIFALIAGMTAASPPAHAADAVYAFSCPESAIKGYIPYNVIGMYRSIYKKCAGTVVYDNSKKRIKSVEIKIASASIVSNCKWCDDVVRSKRVMESAVYPSIVFKSTHVENRGDFWRAYGTLELHGVTKKMASNFDCEGPKEDTLFLKGVWKFNRKNFNVIWNKWFDHGGIIVGDHVTVDWQVRAHRI